VEQSRLRSLLLASHGFSGSEVTDKDEILKAIGDGKREIIDAVNAKRAQEAVAMDTLVARSENMDRTLNWIKRQWEKFTRPDRRLP
jgi:hypothetical protein